MTVIRIIIMERWRADKHHCDSSSPVLLFLWDTKGSRSWRVRTLSSCRSGSRLPSQRYPRLSSSSNSSRPLLGLHEGTKGGWEASGFRRLQAFSSSGLGDTPESSGSPSRGSTVQPAGSRGCCAEQVSFRRNDSTSMSVSVSWEPTTSKTSWRESIP